MQLDPSRIPAILAEGTMLAFAHLCAAALRAAGCSIQRNDVRERLSEAAIVAVSEPAVYVWPYESRRPWWWCRIDAWVEADAACPVERVLMLDAFGLHAEVHYIARNASRPAE